MMYRNSKKGTYTLHPCKDQYEYYHWTGSEHGNRYFRVDRLNGKVLQVVLNSGWYKKGRPHCIGVYYIEISSFVGTYYHYLGRDKDLAKYNNNTRLKITTKRQFEKAMEEIIKTFKIQNHERTVKHN